MVATVAVSKTGRLQRDVGKTLITALGFSNEISL